MLLTLAVVLSILAILILLGYPIVALFFGNKDSIWQLDSISVLGFSLLIGFGLSGFASATSYGITGINSYPVILSTILIINWTVLYFRKKLNLYLLKRFKTTDWLLLVPITASIYMSSSQWGDLFNPRLRVGPGPDVSQNLMAAQNASGVDQTWFSSINSIKKFLQVDNYEQAALNQFRFPSVRDVASNDYLVFGGRWGLTVPFSQIIKLLGPRSVLWETSIVLTLSLISFSVIFFVLGKQLGNSVLLPVVLSSVLVTNSTLIYQFINGGLSQIMGAVSLSGLLLTYLLLLNDKNKSFTLKDNLGLAVVAISCWIASLVTYIDALFVVTSALLISTLVILFSDKNSFRRLITCFYIPGLLSLILVPTFTYSNFLSLNLRIQAASGTGFFSERWKLPSEQFGFINSYSSINTSTTTDMLSAVIFSLIVITLLYFLLISRSNMSLVSVALGASIIVGVGYYYSISSNQKSSYIYEKVSVYLTPLIVASIFTLLSNHTLGKKYNLKKQLLVLLSAICILSGIHFQETYFRNIQTTIIPNALGDILSDKEVQKEFSNFNYLMPYKPEYNYMGLLGASYWISKAPNDFIMSNRNTNELRLLCFALDSGCKPTTKKIANDKLDLYGIFQYESPLTTSQFSSLTIDEKFNANFDAFGMVRELVPEKFKGGNPYFK
jgi:hypothetical protein